MVDGASTRLLGEQTRASTTTSISRTNHFDAARYTEVMSVAGYRPKPTDAGTPRNFVMVDDVCSVKSTWLSRRSRRRDPGRRRLRRVRARTGSVYEVGAWEGWGTIDGERVPCCTAEFQVRSHSTYEPDFDDYRDVRALCERFGIALPEVYERFHASRGRTATTVTDELAARALVGDARARRRAEEGLAERRVGGEDVVGLVALLDRADEVGRGRRSSPS